MLLIAGIALCVLDAVALLFKGGAREISGIHRNAGGAARCAQTQPSHLVQLPKTTTRTYIHDDADTHTCARNNSQSIDEEDISEDDRSVAGKHEVDAWVWHQVRLELCDVNIESTIEAQGSCEGRDDLGQQTVQVGVGWALDVLSHRQQYWSIKKGIA